MDIVSVSCSQCHHDLGSLLNLWTQIGKGYISPVVHTALNVTPNGTIKHGEKGTIVDNCRVQEVVCALCRSVLGSKCLNSAINHVLREGSLLLRMPSIQIKDPDNYDSIRPIIDRVLSLKNPPSHGSQDGNDSPPFYKGYDHQQEAAEHPEINYLLKKIDAQGERIELLDTAGLEVVSSLDRSLQQIGETIRFLKDDMTCAKKELSNNSSKTTGLSNDVLSVQMEMEEVKRTLQPLTGESHLEKERLSVETAMADAKTSLQIELCGMSETYLQKANLLGSKLENIQRDLQEFKTTAHGALLASSANSEEIATLRSELGRLRQELTVERPPKLSSIHTGFTSHEIDIFTSNITKIGNKASQIEPLQMELELLKSRLQKMEAQAPVWQGQIHATFKEKEPQQSLRAPDYRYSNGLSMSDCAGPSATAMRNTPGGKISQSSPPNISYSAPDLSSSPNAPGKRKRTNGPRITKSGAVDKRSLKRQTKVATDVRTSGKG